MKIERFEDPGLAQYSYLIASKGQAVVIDPRRDIDVYMDYADSNHLKITHILETHIHADYASGAVELAEATGAELWLSGHDEDEDYRYNFPHDQFRDGEELMAGNARIVALHTPGHTPEHLSFLVYDQHRCGYPLALLSGDLLFVGSLGRPDLLGEGAQRQLAAQLYDSIHRKIATLPDGVEIHPAHGAGSLCGAGMADRPQSTLGYERSCNIFMAGRSRDEFAETILATLPPFPDYYRRMKRINAEGPKRLHGIPGGKKLPPAEFRALMESPEAVVIDLRRPEAYGGAHIPGAFNIGAGPNLSMWASWVVPYDRPILLVGDNAVNLEEARRALIRVGLDDVVGYLDGGMASWIEAGFEQAHVPQISVGELYKERGRRPLVLDVRSDSEWSAGHIEGAVHIPAGDLPKRASELIPGSPIHVICGSGYRSSIAAGVLRRAGFENVVNVVGGMGAWNRQRLPVVKETPQMSRV